MQEIVSSLRCPLRGGLQERISHKTEHERCGNKLQDKDRKRFDEVTTMKYADQAVFFLNAFWPEISAADEKEGGAEKVWGYWQKILEIDKLQYGALPEDKRPAEWSEGSSLDEFWSHKYLETFGKVLTAIKFREEFRKIDLNFDRKMALVEFLLFDYKYSVDELMSRPQGTNEELVKAKAALEAVQAEIKTLESKKSDLEKKSEVPGVKGNAARNELEQLLTQDPIPLNRALVTAEAAVRKAQRLKGDQPQGALYWIGRELEEAKKYKPKRKQ